MAVTSKYMLNEALVGQISAELDLAVQDRDIPSIISMLNKYAQNYNKELKAAVINSESLLSFIIQLSYIDSSQAEMFYALSPSYSSMQKNGDNYLQWLPVEVTAEVFPLCSDRRILVNLLLENGLAENMAKNRNIVDRNENTLLHKAIEYGADPFIVETLIQNGADIYQRNGENETSLEATLYWGRPLLTNQILAHSEYVEGEPILHYLIKHNRNELALLELVLKKESTDVNKKNEENKTPLHLAVSCRDQAIVNMLLQNGANPNEKDGDENTPLHLAVGYSDQAIVNMLLRNGANPNEKDENGNTPLHLAVDLAVRYQDLKIMHILLQNGADINEKDSDGNTPLHLLCLIFINARKQVEIETESELERMVKRKKNSSEAESYKKFKLRLMSELSEEHVKPYEIYIGKTVNGLEYAVCFSGTGLVTGPVYNISTEDLTENFLEQHKNEIILCCMISYNLKHHQLCDEDFYKFVYLLLSAGASVREENGCKKTPLDYVNDSGCSTVIALLEEYMSKSCRNEEPSSSSSSSNPFSFLSLPAANTAANAAANASSNDNPKMSPK
jgi:ankyrin repeat protein